jgi:hypothetical protein
LLTCLENTTSSPSLSSEAIFCKDLVSVCGVI